jgi:CheY-like chemotaxis protein
MLKGVKILVTEDDKLNQKIVKFVLQKQGAEVVIASNGHEAISLLEKNNFDIILMDLQMPGMDGYATARHIRTQFHNDVPIIALTADMVANLTNEYRDAGINACISKPIQSNDLCKLILSFVNQYTVEH